MAAAASAAPGAVTRMICSTLCTLRARVSPGARIAGLDVTPTHLTFAISDAGLTSAAPLGVLRRSASAAIDARILAGALERAGDKLRVGALVVGSPPGAPPSAYVSDLLKDPALLPDVTSVLYYSEATAVLRAARAAHDVARAAEAARDARESRKRRRFQTAMFPDIESELIRTDRAARARVSVTEILQAALDDLSRIPRDVEQ